MAATEVSQAAPSATQYNTASPKTPQTKRLSTDEYPFNNETLKYTFPASADSPGGLDSPQSQKIVSFADPSPSEGDGPQRQSGQDSRILPTSEVVDTSRQSRFAYKIRSLALPLSSTSHTKSSSLPTVRDASNSDYAEHIAIPPTPMSVETSQSEPNILQDDAKTTASGLSNSRGPQSTRNPGESGNRTAPTTPRYQSFRDLITRIQTSEARPQLVRRSTMTDLPESSGEAVSEDEGRESRRREWRKRGSEWVHRRQSLSEPDGDTVGDSRPSNFRRITAGLRTPEGTPFALKVRSEAGAQRWRQFKATFKMIGQRKREENKDDQVKSAELMAELLAGSPAALIIASSFQRDESKKRRIPVLLDQLKIHITDSQRREDSAGDRHVVFRIELEYGSGIMRMKWIISRSLRDFVNLHVKYKLESRKIAMSSIQLGESEGSAARQKKARLPKFPKEAFPYLRGVRGLMEDDEEEEEGNVPKSKKKSSKGKSRESSLAHTRQRSSEGGTPIYDIPTPFSLPTPGILGPDGTGMASANKKDLYADRQRRRLEVYLKELIRFTIFRAGSNRLCRFLELSALGIKLSAEGGYHGKECSLSIQSGKGVDFRKALTPATFFERHRPKWFLVRHSYIVCVDSPEDMNVYDVFLVDGAFDVRGPRQQHDRKNVKSIAKSAKKSAAHPSGHLLRIKNTERKLRLLAKNERQLLQFEESIRFMVNNTGWSKTNRFDSFAPVRQNAYAQWLVDGRDYMWNVSRAIDMAQDVIYIHDWWLSPELYMRRPAAISQKWRLDRLLKRKAEQGVKVFVIMYRNINSAIPIDSEYSKFSLLDLHPNIFVQRSPNQVRQNVFFWAHHEKICIIDHAIAFMGGVDLCFGRWDTPQHLLVDDKPTGFELGNIPRNGDQCQLWPGKDYSNPRVLDFYKLDEPYAEMYDRTKVPRMPWHDIAMQIVGQPARDLTRHFVQRWNYILRQRKPSRPTPFLLPPPDFVDADLEAMDLDGTCNVQILRSACDWSLGTPNKTEHSIMNAYIKLIQTSEHFVYIENQFFITSCTVEGNKIENKIGDALVERIKRAYERDEDWRCVIVIPLMPGFQNTVDAQDGTSIRLIMQCQYRSISRGETSIFGRLRSAGIEPEDYIQFYSLRTWGKIGPNKALVTEQLYIHAKCMVVDDRYAIIGSANINERSMLGDRDSEVAAIVWDNDMLDSTMGGVPYRVGRFPHTLRMRLMREHLGLDTDEIMHEERLQREDQGAFEQSDEGLLDPEAIDGGESESLAEQQTSRLDLKDRLQEEFLAKAENIHSFNHDADWLQAKNPHLLTKKKKTHDSRVTNNELHEKDIKGEGADHMASFKSTPDSRGRDSVVRSDYREFLVNDVAPEGREDSCDNSSVGKGGGKSANGIVGKKGRSNMSLPPWEIARNDTEELGLSQLSQLPALPIEDDTDIGGPPLIRSHSNASMEALKPLLAEMRRPVVERDCMKDPLSDTFFIDTWHAVAENNTKLFRQVFRCMPDTQVTDWKEYEAFTSYSERFARSQGIGQDDPARKDSNETPDRSGPPGWASDVASELQTASRDRTSSLSTLKAQASGNANQSLLRKISTTFSQRKGSVRSNRNNSAGAAAQTEKEKEKLTEIPSTNTEGEITNEKSPAAGGGLLQPPFSSRDDRMQPPSTANGDENKKVDFSSLSPPSRDSPSSMQGVERETSRPDTGTQSSQHQQRRRRRATTKSSAALRPTDPILNKADAESLLNFVQGHLVTWPYDWLLREERGGKWLYPVDQMAPLEIYD